MKEPYVSLALFPPRMRQHVIGIKNVPSSLPEGILSKSYVLNPSDHRQRLLSLFSASGFCRFWRRRQRGTVILHVRYNILKNTVLSCRNLSTAIAVGRWEKRNCSVKNLDPVVGEPCYWQERVWALVLLYSRSRISQYCSSFLRFIQHS